MDIRRKVVMRYCSLRTVLSIITLAMFAIIVACSSSDATPTTGTGGSSEPTATPDSPVGSGGETGRNRTLVLPLAGNQIVNFDNFNSYALGNQTHRTMLSKGVHEMMFYANLNTGEMIPGQAESFEYNDTYDEVTIHLREGVKWSDGEPFTSEDVVFTLNLLNDSGTAIANVPFERGVMTNIEAVDELTVKLTLRSPNPRWFWRTFVIAQENHVPIMPKHIWEGQDLEEFKFNDVEQGWPVGTGAYQVERFSAQSVVLTRRATWWAAETGVAEMPDVEQITFIPAGDRGSQAIMLINNEVDVATIDVGDFLSARNRNGELRSWSQDGPVFGPPDGCVYRLALNNAAPPFDNPDVRWAVNYAIDRSTVVDLAYESSNSIAVMPFSTFGGVQEYVGKFQDIIDEFGPDDHDLAKTDELMQRAGYVKGGDGFWSMDGERLQLTLYSPTFLQVIPPVVAEQLRIAGFDVVTNVTEGTGNRDFMMTGEFDFTVEVHCGSLREPFDTLNDFHSKWSAPVGERLSYVHASTRYSNPEYDTIIEQMEAMVPSPDDPDYVDLIRRAVRIWLTDMPEIVLAEERHVIVFNEHYWQGWATEENPTAAPFFCCWSSPYQIILDLEPAS